jgi:uncharacterized protein YciI
MFVVTLTYVKPLAEIDALIPAHIAWLERQYAAGHFLASGRRVPRVGGVILAQGVSRDALRRCWQRIPSSRQRRPIIRWWSLFRP